MKNFFGVFFRRFTFQNLFKKFGESHCVQLKHDKELREYYQKRYQLGQGRK